MEQNKFEIAGRINHTEIKDYTNCKVAKFAVSKKIGEDKYVSYWVTMFDDKAVEAEKKIKKGDCGYFSGKMSISTYTVNGQEVPKIDLIASEAKKVVYDTNQKQYIEVYEEEQKGIEDWD